MRYTVLLFLATCAFAQEKTSLTLAQAEEQAIHNHPRIASAELLSKAATTQITQARAAYFPVFAGQFTGAGADTDTVIAAGQLQTAALSNRAATGVSLSQLITDFGRTANLTEAARLRAAAGAKIVGFNRALVLLQVDRAYYTALGSEAVLQVAQATLDARKLTLRQVRSLAQSQMKSTLDVSFAEVAVSEAELALYQAENAAKASQALLAAALGAEDQQAYRLEDVPLPPAPPPDSGNLVRDAMEARPDLAALRFTQQAAGRTAEAERRLRFPTLSVVGVTGVIPFHQTGLTDKYGGVGLNVTLPILNGGLFKARQQEAEFRALAAGKNVQDLAVQIASAVRVAVLEANTAYRRLDVTARLVAQAEQALRLANSRYQLGLGSILEVTQAQLAHTAAQIGAASAKYDYLRRVADLRYAEGALQ